MYIIHVHTYIYNSVRNVYDFMQFVLLTFRDYFSCYTYAKTLQHGFLSQASWVKMWLHPFLGMCPQAISLLGFQSSYP